MRAVMITMVIFHIIFHDTNASFFSSVCEDRYGIYTANSTFKNNLKTYFSTIANDTHNNYGFYNFSIGYGVDMVNGLGLCRPDVTVSDCHKCLNNVSDEIEVNCPNQKGAIGWYEACMIHYSNGYIFGKLLFDPWYHINATQHFIDKQRFNRTAADLLAKLQKEAAAFNDSRYKFAAGEVKFSNLIFSLYALVQCTPDLEQYECYTCLDQAIAFSLSYAYGETARVFYSSCNIRYETYPFYNQTNLKALRQRLQLPPSTKGWRNRGKRNTWIVVGIMALLFMLLSTLVYCYRKRKPKLHKEVEGNDDQIKCVDSLQFDFNTIRVATDNFSDSTRIGQGSSAIVYKGFLPSGQEVAVKRLHNLGKEGEAKFDNEVLLSSNLQHKNVLKFVGYCINKKNRFLIYEFVPNGSLCSFLNDPIKHAQLDWETRCILIQGIARGLLYLHEDSQLRVIHRNLKPKNIVLSVNMTPKISNFCKASLDNADHTRESTNTIKGTFGYMAPECVLKGHFSIKSDVFSFGVILLEMISGQMISTISDGDDNESLTVHAWKKWSEGKAMDVADQTMLNLQNYTHEITRCINIALLCVQANPTHRPSMSTVVLMLNSDNVPIPEPSKPGFMLQNEVYHNSQTSNSRLASVNEDSIPDVEPR